MNIDYAIRKDKPTITDTSTTAEKAPYEQCERSNWLSLMFIKTKFYYGIRCFVDQHDNVKALLKAIDEQFVTSDKALASTLIMKFSSLRLTDEGRLKMELGESTLMAMEGKDQNQAKKKKKGKILPQGGIKKVNRCFFCKKKGHMKRVAPNSKNGLRRKVMQNLRKPMLSDRQPIIEVPQIADDNPIYQVVQDSPEIVEQPVEQRDSQENVDTTLRISTKARKTTILSDYVVYLQESDYDIGTENDPETFSQAISCKESNLWYDAMKDEMNSMASNGVWNLVELPNGAKAIGCKWVFKTKNDSLGNIERYKARLFAKEFTQNEGIDYKENFSPVSKKDSLRIIMTLVAHFDLEFQQMDVKQHFSMEI
ncbi:Retrovirus-related Pol polyprotein from transposon TNT 1-94 [Vitis vinifera]|uniref:Retrovirus-related Pol polyprotein from transposon TNT 1-94 n=1 Tax=Vitis vinifera TaxID=29760 RepID=A0A438E4I3_VITVI|nr:Retrovirus-related Pol polyprotein from transposon TNT 1-94 [Vitis vinifera]